ncbi:MAG: hypothetical protein HUJ30_06290, partial [Gammaproteobacteria bacterium]|nr:hypothetical protein [Gammaproteobacteria bacterium]
EIASTWYVDLGMEWYGRLRVGGLLLRTGLIDKIAKDNLAYTPFTQLANLTGQPAMSVPMHWSREGLPVGVQLIAPHAREDRLFRLASQLEQAQHWFDRLPEEI